MKAITQFIVRQSGWLTFFFLLFAVLNGVSVLQGLWQGVGLHGYLVQHNKANGAYVVPVWRSFMQAGVFACLGSSMLIVNVWHRAKISRIVVNPGGMGNKGPNVVIFRSRSSRRPRR